jgi:hypothetical protein
LEANQRDIDRLYQAINELRKEMRERFDRIDLRISELREHTDRSIDELRKHTDQQLAAGLAEVRREASVNMRRMMGMWLTTIGLVVGVGGRVFGMY